MRYDAKARSTEHGFTLGELRRFVRMTEQMPEDARLDCLVPSETPGKSALAALMGVEVTADVDCPGCGVDMPGDAVKYALSRMDNRTFICSDCGTQEALADFFGSSRYSGTDA